MMCTQHILSCSCSPHLCGLTVWGFLFEYRAARSPGTGVGERAYSSWEQCSHVSLSLKTQ